MKISFAISVSSTNFDAVGQGQWRQMLQFISSLGYDGVELAIRDPETIDISQLQSTLENCRLKLVAIGTGQAYVDEQLSLTSGQETVRLKTVERLKKHIDLAYKFNSPVIIGLIRGKLGRDEKERKTKFSNFKNSIVELADYARKKDVFLLIEALNRYECDFFNRAEEVVNFISSANCKNIMLMLDTFHMNIEEQSIDQAIIRSQLFLKHIHIADSNRWYPGKGHLDFQEIIATLRRMYYDGFLSGEMLPLPNLQTTMREYIKRIKEVLSG